MLPRSLQKLVQETEYPPQKPELMMSRTNKVVMIVETVSPTPFSLLRRANHFQYRDTDRALQEFSAYEDPIEALSEECRRVLKAVSAANQSQVSSSKHSTSLREASWSRFEDVGFSSALEEDDDDESALAKKQQEQPLQALRDTPASGNGLDRPTTPSWADFLSSGFVDDNQSRSNLLLPPDKVLPPIDTQNRQRSSQSHRPRLESDRDLDPGELASITFVDLDDAFWWVWMSSLAPEETSDRKAAFGRCAVVETKIRAARWLVMEEMVAGAAPEPQEGAYIAEKKSFFSWTRRGRTLGRRKSTGKQALDRNEKNTNTFGTSKTSIGPDTHARIQAKAAQLRAADDREKQEAANAARRGRTGQMSDKTNSVATLQPQIAAEASSAMKWAKKYDKGSIKDAYLANSNAGRGMAVSPAPTENTNGHAEPNGSMKQPEKAPEVPVKDTKPEPTPEPKPEPEVEAPTTNPKAVPSRKPVGAAPAPAPVPEKQPEPVPEPKPEATPQPEPEPEVQAPTPPAKDEPAPEPEAPTPEPVAAAAPEPKKKLPKDKSGGLRKLFSRKNRSSKVPDNAAADVNAMLRKDSEASAPTPEPIVEQNEEPITPGAQTPKNEPNNGDNLSRVNTKDDLEAQAEFARFDQGPLSDQPAFAPDDVSDDEGDATPPPIARRPTQRANSSLRESSLKSSVEPPKEEHLNKTAGPGVQDRWAQIRKNAADRAASYQKEDAAVSPPRERKAPREKGEDDDDDTSGEESE